jgi:hypothetical protein
MVGLEEVLVEEMWRMWVETEIWAKGTVVVALTATLLVLAVAVLVR